MGDIYIFFFVQHLQYNNSKAITFNWSVFFFSFLFLFLFFVFLFALLIILRCLGGGLMGRGGILTFFLLSILILCKKRETKKNIRIYIYINIYTCICLNITSQSIVCTEITKKTKCAKLYLHWNYLYLYMEFSPRRWIGPHRYMSHFL